MLTVDVSFQLMYWTTAFVCIDGQSKEFALLEIQTLVFRLFKKVKFRLSIFNSAYINSWHGN